RADLIFTMLPDAPDVEAVYFGPEGILAAARPGQLYIDMSTSSPTLARRIAERAEGLGAEALDAPVSGGEAGAVAGRLAIMVGGSERALRRALPFLQVLGQTIVHVGGPGAGQVVKACNQLMVAAHLEAAAEAMALAQAAGVDPAVTRQALLGGYAFSRVLEVHGERALRGDFAPGFRISLHDKDLRLALELAAGLHLSLPLAELAKHTLSQAVAEGEGGRDHSWLIGRRLSLVEPRGV
ncbi:MAG: NAD(P)-dependent oxidoreductase, partial [Firmicutes bacterium]|nr:NAD(P)-dependent oxidoreductase [Bacillota bacterium]